MPHLFHRWMIRLGLSDLTLSIYEGVTFSIEKVSVHPKYNGTAYFDIAVLQINQVLPHLRQVCLPDSSKFEIDQHEERAATLIAWRNSFSSAQFSKTIKRINLTIFEYR